MVMLVLVKQKVLKHQDNYLVDKYQYLIVMKVLILNLWDVYLWDQLNVVLGVVLMNLIDYQKNNYLLLVNKYKSEKIQDKISSHTLVHSKSARYTKEIIRDSHMQNGSDCDVEI